MYLLDIAGIAISSFFILFILSKKNVKKTDWLLTVINIGIIALLVVDALFQEELSSTVFLLLNIIPLYFFPFFLIYALEILQEKVHHHGRWLLFFIPAVITTIYIVKDLFILHHYDQNQLEQLYNHPTLWYHLLCKGFPIIFIFAFIWLIKRIKIYGQEIRENYSFIDPIELDWLIKSTWIYIAITILSLLGFLTSQLHFLPVNTHTVCSVIGILMFIAIFYVSFYGIKQFTINDYYGKKEGDKQIDAVRITELSEPDSNVSIKYKSSNLKDQDQQIIFNDMIRLFEEKKLYLESKLQLSDVANALQLSAHHVSQTINSISGKPFYDFVNGYRVNHLQKLLEDPTKQKNTILSLGFESGFNSKASLNRVFKQETGLSPSEYLQRHQFNQVASAT